MQNLALQIRLARMHGAMGPVRTGQRYGRTGQMAPNDVAYGAPPYGGVCAPRYASPGECPPPGCGPLATALGRDMAGYTGRCREVPFALNDTVAIAGTTTLTGTAQGTICANRLVIVGTGDGFEISSFKIGENNQFIGTGVLHSSMFAPDSVQAIPLKGDCLGPGITVSLTVTNLDAAEQDIYVALFGPAQY